MSEERISRLEEKTGKIDVTLGKIETTLEQISINIVKAVDIKDEVTTLKVKCENFEKSLDRHIEDDEVIHKDIRDKVYSYSIASAGVSATLAIIVPIILSLLTK